MGASNSINAREDTTVPRPLQLRNAGQSLIDNLSIDLSDHLYNVHKGSYRVVNFVETRWLPQRISTIKDFQTYIGLSVDQNILVNKIQLSGKVIGAGGKFVAVGGIAFLPIAAGGLVLSLLGDGLALGACITRSVTLKGRIEKAESMLKDDWAVTLKFQELLEGYHLLLENVENSVRRFHKATRDGCFDRIKASPAIAKFLLKVRSTANLNPQSIKEIIKEFVKALQDEQSRQDISDAVYDFVTLNPGLLGGVILGVKMFVSSFSLLIMTSRMVAGKFICCGLNFLLIVKDFDEIAKLVAGLENGNDELVTEMKNILTVLETEKFLIEDGIKEEEEE